MIFIHIGGHLHFAPIFIPRALLGPSLGSPKWADWPPRSLGNRPQMGLWPPETPHIEVLGLPGALAPGNRPQEGPLAPGNPLLDALGAPSVPLLPFRQDFWGPEARWEAFQAGIWSLWPLWGLRETVFPGSDGPERVFQPRRRLPEREKKGSRVPNWPSGASQAGFRSSRGVPGPLFSI